jgi:nicotinic acid phosphoribosyltransferase
MTGPLLTPEAMGVAAHARCVAQVPTDVQLQRFLAAHDSERLALDFYRTLDDGTGRDLAVAKAFARWLGIGGHQPERFP